MGFVAIFWLIADKKCGFLVKLRQTLSLACDNSSMSNEFNLPQPFLIIRAKIMSERFKKVDNVQWERVFYGRELMHNILKTIETKDIMSKHYRYRYLSRAMMAGFIVAVITVFTLRIKSMMLPEVNDGITMLTASYGFSFALVMILFTNSELLTSNFMYFTVGMYYKKIKASKVMNIWMLCLLGNYLGSFVVFALMYGANIIQPAEVDMLVHVTEAKTVDSSAWTIFSKAIFANFFINNAVVIAMQMKDTLAKIFVMMFGVMIFAFMGYEHVVANGSYFIGALMYAPNQVEMLPILKNIFFSFWGNYVGGGLIIGLFYAYLNDNNNIPQV